MASLALCSKVHVGLEKADNRIKIGLRVRDRVNAVKDTKEGKRWRNKVIINVLYHFFFDAKTRPP